MDITAESVARAFVLGLIARFGVPSTVITDHGRQFESNLWSQLSQRFGILKSALKCYSIPYQWIDALPLVLLGIGTAMKYDLKCTTAELVYGVTQATRNSRTK